MNTVVHALLSEKTENHILPFFWLHGEKEAVLRDYMRAIHSCGIGAVCLESRPHPDYRGPRWWQDVDIILDEAKRRGMKVWILDDSHFPTGFANGAMKNAPLELRRQGLCYRGQELAGGEISLDTGACLQAPNRKSSGPFGLAVEDAPSLPEDTLLSVTAVEQTTGELRDLTENVEPDGSLRASLPRGTWRLGLCKPLMEKPCYAPLKNPDVFQGVYLDYGVPVWNNGEIDIAPEYLYERSKAM